MKMRSFLLCAVCIVLLTMCKKDDESPSQKANFDFSAADAHKNRKMFTYYGNTDYDEYSDAVLLTEATGDQWGGAFYKLKQDISRGFEAEFEFSVTYPAGIIDCQNYRGGDGFAFILIASSDITVGGGGGLGYSGTSNSLAVEIDTWCNSNLGDANGNHVSVHSGGAGPNSSSEQYSLGSVTNIVNVSDGNKHKLGIFYSAKTITIYLDGSEILKSENGTFDIAKILQMENNQAYIGLTATTGSAYERHNIHRFKLKVF